MIYLFLVLTAWEVEINISENKNNNQEVELTDSQKELLLFLDELFKGRRKTALNGIDVISFKTGIDYERCKYWRTYLSELKIDGNIAAITVDKGVCRANYNYQVIRDFIVNHQINN